jgi:SAM-dependent methyltransferase
VSTLGEHRRIWQEKPVLRAIYEDCYRRIVAECVPGLTLEVGGGTGNLKAFLPEVVSTDIQHAPWMDAVADAQRLPFRDVVFANIVMFDVLHHLERPARFLEEALRTLVPGGRVVVCEPAVTPVSWSFYTFLHPEPVRLGEDPLAEGELSPDRDPYDSNQAIPTRLFGRDRGRLEARLPGLRALEPSFFSLFAYPLSGGFRRWSLLPRGLVGPLLGLERRLEPVFGRAAGFRLLGVIEKSLSAGQTPSG